MEFLKIEYWYFKFNFNKIKKIYIGFFLIFDVRGNGCEDCSGLVNWWRKFDRGWKLGVCIVYYLGEI